MKTTLLWRCTDHVFLTHWGQNQIPASNVWFQNFMMEVSRVQYLANFTLLNICSTEMYIQGVYITVSLENIRGYLLMLYSKNRYHKHTDKLRLPCVWHKRALREDNTNLLRNSIATHTSNIYKKHMFDMWHIWCFIHCSLCEHNVSIVIQQG